MSRWHFCEEPPYEDATIALVGDDNILEFPMLERAMDHALKALEPRPSQPVPTEREHLLAARKEAFDFGCTLTRLARDCDHAADEAFRKAQRIAEQIRAVKP